MRELGLLRRELCADVFRKEGCGQHRASASVKTARRLAGGRNSATRMWDDPEDSAVHSLVDVLRQVASTVHAESGEAVRSRSSARCRARFLFAFLGEIPFRISGGECRLYPQYTARSAPQNHGAAWQRWWAELQAHQEKSGVNAAPQGKNNHKIFRHFRLALLRVGQQAVNRRQDHL